MQKQLLPASFEPPQQPKRSEAKEEDNARLEGTVDTKLDAHV